MRARGYSIWLISDNALFDELRAIIRKLGRKYGAPVFEPHITLLGQIMGTEEDLKFKTEQLAKKLKSFLVCFGRYSGEENYFKPLFLEVERSPELMGADKLARTIFNIAGDVEYQPHLSLVYGLFDKETKNKMEKDLTGKNFAGLCQTVNRLALYHTEGEVNKWRKVFEIGFDI